MKSIFLFVKTQIITASLLLGINTTSQAQPNPPLMGWASWNSFRCNINEQLIKQQVIVCF